MSNTFITEYSEMEKAAQVTPSDPDSVKDGKSFDDEPEALVVTFSEEPKASEFIQISEEPVMVVSPAEGDILEFSEDKDELMDSEDMEAMPFRLPGVTDYVIDDKEEEGSESEPEETDWENDRDVKHFMAYIIKAYPDGIPSHDGSSTLGCERAVHYLTKLNKEISEALRADHDDILDIPALENYRVNMLKDMVTLKEHAKKLNKKHKKAEQENEIVKEATTPRIQLIMTPFERAITGIIINSVISAGKPLEDVYEFLKKKYDFTEREELTILQLLMDMGHPIFKDRGTLGENTKDDEGHGIDFIKNYFG